MQQMGQPQQAATMTYGAPMEAASTTSGAPQVLEQQPQVFAQPPMQFEPTAQYGAPQQHMEFRGHPISVTYAAPVATLGQQMAFEQQMIAPGPVTYAAPAATVVGYM